MNSITELLDLEDFEITISDTTIEGQTKFITLETAPISTLLSYLWFPNAFQRTSYPKDQSSRPSGWLSLGDSAQAAQMEMQ